MLPAPAPEKIRGRTTGHVPPMAPVDINVTVQVLSLRSRKRLRSEPLLNILFEEARSPALDLTRSPRLHPVRDQTTCPS